MDPPAKVGVGDAGQLIGCLPQGGGEQWCCRQHSCEKKGNGGQHIGLGGLSPATVSTVGGPWEGWGRWRGRMQFCVQPAATVQQGAVGVEVQEGNAVREAVLYARCSEFITGTLQEGHKVGPLEVVLGGGEALQQ